MKPVYVLDTSVLISLGYGERGDQTGPVWKWMEAVGQEGRIKIPKLILDEEYTNDQFKPWYVARPYLVEAHSDHQDECLAELMGTLPDFIDTKPAIDADQPLVALAMSINHQHAACFSSGPAVVVTLERHRMNKEPRLRIPDACHHYGITCINVFEMLAMDGALRT